jgi:hypothetical protein
MLFSLRSRRNLAEVQESKGYGRVCGPAWLLPRTKLAASRLGPISGVSVQEMVGDGGEVIVGVSCDPHLGPVLLFGSGGVMVEVYNDVALRRCPITRREAQGMIAEVKGARLLQGYRGRPAADLEALGIRWCGCRISPCTWKRSWQSWTSIRSWSCRRVGGEGGGRPSRVSRHVAVLRHCRFTASANH